MSVTNCPSCNSPVPPGSVFCDNCGYDLRTVAPAVQQPVAPTQVAQPVAEAGCPTCGHVNVPGAAFCENCGSQLSQAAPAYQPPAAPPPIAPPPVTPPPAITPPVYQPPAYQPPAYQQPAPPAAPAAQIGFITGKLVLQASNTSLPIPQGKQVAVMGREDPVSGIFPEIDLDPYGAQEDGVGRKHAQLVLQGGQVCIEDLDSVNGTAVNKQKIAPHQPRPLKDGDELRLGKMVIIYHAQ